MKYVLFLPIILAIGCGSGSNPDVYRIGEHGWTGDTIYFKVYRRSEPLARDWPSNLTVECQSCNLIDPPTRVELNDAGIAQVFIPETRETISARLRVEGHGIDTTFIQTQRTPAEAMRRYALAAPLVGRVLVTHLALLYRDTTQDSTLTTALAGDEMNLYREQRGFFVVHHPRFPQPLYLLKSDAVRLY